MASFEEIKFRISVECHCQKNPAGQEVRGRPFTFIFLQHKSYPLILTTMISPEVGVRFSPRYHYINWPADCLFTCIAVFFHELVQLTLKTPLEGGGGGVEKGM